MRAYHSYVRPRLAVLAAALLLLTACVDDVRPSGCDAETVELLVTLDAAEMTPRSLAVCRGQEVTLAVDSSVDAVFHVHGYDDALPAASVVAGETAELTFTADREGQFPIEIHPSDDPQGIEVGILTVHAT